MATFANAYVRPSYEARKRGEQFVRPTDSAFAIVFFGFTEISSTLDALTLAETLIGHAPPSTKRVKKSEYLRFLIGAYFQEIYILEQRLTAYAKKIARLYKITEQALLLESIQSTFGGIIKTRGAHVHSNRFSDEGLDLLTGLELVGDLRGEPKFEADFDYSHVQADWSKRVKTNNIATCKLIDVYCDHFFSYLTRDEAIFLPPAGRLPLNARKS